MRIILLLLAMYILVNIIDQRTPPPTPHANELLQFHSGYRRGM